MTQTLKHLAKLGIPANLFLVAILFTSSAAAQLSNEPAWRLESLLAALNDPNEEVQRAAVDWAGGRKVEDPHVAAKFAEMLFRPTWKKDRVAVVKALNSTGTNRHTHIQSLVRTLSDPDASVRRQAIGVFIQFRSSESLVTTALFERLTDTDVQVRRQAIAALTNAAISAAVSARSISHLLRDSHSDVRGYAVEVLGSLGTDALPYLSPLIGVLDDPEISVRVRAIQAVSKLQGTNSEFKAVLVRMLDDLNQEIRLKAVEAIARLDELSTNVLDRIWQLGIDRNQNVRNKAVALLLSRNNPISDKLREEFADTFINSKPENKAYVLSLLESGERAGVVFAPEVRSLLRDPDRWVRINAVKALLALDEGGARYSNDIVAMMTDPDEEVRMAAFEVVGRMRGGEEAVFTQGRSLIGDQNYPNRERLIDILARKGPREERTALLICEQLSDMNPNVKRRAASELGGLGHLGAKCAPQLVELLHDPDARTRQTAVQALGTMGPAAASHSEHISTLLNDPDKEVRIAAMQTLSRVADHFRYAAQIAKLLKDPETDVRTRVIQTLGKMGEAGAGFSAHVVACTIDLNDGSRRSGAEVAASALEEMGIPLDVKTLLACLEVVHAGRRSEAGKARLLAYLARTATPTNLLLIRWLGHRSEAERPSVLSADDARLSMEVIRSIWPLLLDYPDARKEAAEVLTLFARKGSWKQSDVPSLMELEREFRDAGLFSQASDVGNVINRFRRLSLLLKFLYGFLIQLGLWILLLIVYPSFPFVRGLFFWNPWVRRVFGTGWVGFVIPYVGWARRRLFVPFRDVLVPRRVMESADSGFYFDESEVVEQLRGNRNLVPELIHEAIPQLHGQIVLEGQSGVGKTLFLQRMAAKSQRIAAFLNATDCVNGVLPAIQKKLHGQVRDEAYLKVLIYSGALDILIDGLNEASPDARARISQFFEEYSKGNFILSTQRLSGWLPPPTARVFELQPLRSDQIADFLLKQWLSLKDTARIPQAAFTVAVHDYLRTQARPSLPSEDQRLNVLRNPMEARLAAELLAQGETPDLFRLMDQRFKLMSADFRAKNGSEFPLKRFAEAVYVWRRSDEADINMGNFGLEALELVNHRLMIRRTDPIRTAQDEIQRTRWFFRHDRIMEYFLLPAFLGDEGQTRRFEHIKDERFWGVYDLLATRLPESEERELYTWLNDWAADSNDNELRNRYQKARRMRATPAKPNEQG